MQITEKELKIDLRYISTLFIIFSLFVAPLVATRSAKAEAINETLATSVNILQPQTAPPAVPLTLVVDTDSDNGALSACTGTANDCSLRGAITNANANAGADTITFLSTVSQIVLLGNGGLPPITDDLVIAGPGAHRLTVRRDAADLPYRIFRVVSGNVTFSGMTISGGSTSGEGGGISNSGTLTLTDSTLSGNDASGGGGLFNDGIATITNSRIVGNSAGTGGGIRNEQTITLSQTEVSANTAVLSGGGLSTTGTATIRNSTVSGNIAQGNAGIVPVGGIDNDALLTITNSTVAGNSSTFGCGGIKNPLGSLELNSTIVGNNAAADAPDICGEVSSGDHNLIENLQGLIGPLPGANNITAVDPAVGPLQDNGGSTRTHALLPASFAKDAGSNPSMLTTDQRGAGFDRVVGPAADIGSFEVLPTCSGPAFAAASQPAAGDAPNSIVTGDFNGDLRQDLVITNPETDSVSVLLNDVTGAFLPPTSVDAGDDPRGITAVDFNGDGNLDIATANRASDKVAVLFGDGAGSFSAPLGVDVGDSPVAITSGDFNSDLRQDIAVANEDTNNVSILLNQGLGGWLVSNISVGSEPLSITTGYFDSDLILDLATANASSDSVSVLIGTGNGGFAPFGPFSTGHRPYSIAAGDFNLDGILDVATANEDNISVLLAASAPGDVYGGLAPAVTFSEGDHFRSITTGDFNGDGKPDIAASESSSHSASVLIGDGIGGFAIPESFATPDFPRSITTGDFNSDGKMDLATANEGSDNVSILRNECGTAPTTTPTPEPTSTPTETPTPTTTPTPTSTVSPTPMPTATPTPLPVQPCVNDFFSPQPAIATGDGPRSVVFADLNLDSIQDIVTSGSESDTVDVRLGNGLGGYGPLLSMTVGDRPEGVVTADFNRDGKPDVATANRFSGTISVALGNGDGTFAAPTTLAAGGEPTDLTVADFDRDGKIDIAVALDNLVEDGVVVFYGTPTGFGSPVPVENVGPFPFRLVATDLDVNGTRDLVVIYRDLPPGEDNPFPPGPGKVSVHFKDEFGQEFVGIPFDVDDDPVAVAVGDLNGDGYPDIAIANRLDDSVSLLLSRYHNSPPLYDVVTMLVGEGPRSVAIGDANQDGKSDIVVVNQTPAEAKVLIGNGAGAFTPTSSIPLPGIPYSVAFTDYNLDAKPDLAAIDLAGNGVTILENSCPLFSGAVSGLEEGPSVPADGELFDCDLKDGQCMVTDTAVIIDRGLLGKTTIPVDDPIDVTVVDSGNVSGPASSLKYVYVTTKSSGSGLAKLFNLGGDSRLVLKTFKKDPSGQFQEIPNPIVIDELIASPVTGAITRGDTDADGIDEIMVVDTDENMVRTYKPGGDAVPPAPHKTIFVGGMPTSIISADIDKDGRDEILTINKGTKNISMYRSPTAASLLESSEPIEYEGQGGGSSTPTDFTAADINNDGNLDILVGTDSGVQALTGTGTGSYNEPQAISEEGTEIVSIDTGDMNKDGKLDIVMTTKKSGGETKIESIINTTTLGNPILSAAQGAVLDIEPDSKLMVQTVDDDAQPDIIVKTSTKTSLDSYLGTLYAAPLAASDAYSVERHATLNIAAPGVVGNDAYPAGTNVVVELVSGPANSAGFALNPDGSFSYTAASYNNGSDSFTYKLKDGTLESAPASVNITISLANTAPVANSDSYSVDEDSSLETIEVLANDTDNDGDELTAAVVTNPEHGTLSPGANGMLVYTPDADFNGTDSFTYNVHDGFEYSNTATVWITVNAVNDAPVAVDDEYSVTANTMLGVPYSDGVLANDTDIDSSPIGADVVTPPANGSVQLAFSGAFSYTPNPDFTGIDSFTYKATDGLAFSEAVTVTITVTPGNRAPAATADSYSTNEDTTLTVPASGLLVNDSDADNDALTAVLVSGPANAQAFSLNSDGSLSYTPNANFNGTDSFTYKASDGSLDSNVATVYINVSAVNDAPSAADDSTTVEEDSGANAVDVLGNDSSTPDDGETIYVSEVTQGVNGSVSIIGGGTGVSYTPAANFHGTDSFAYTISDGNGGSSIATVAVTVNAVNDAPTAGADSATVSEDSGSNAIDVLANDSIAPDTEETLSVIGVSQGAHGSVSITGGGTGVTYIPAANYNGPDSFTYTVSDGNGGSAIGTVSITVIGVNDPPEAANDSASVNEDSGSTTLNVLGNDTIVPDADETLTITSVTQGAHGAVSILAGGASVTYTPAANYNGPDSFTYTVSDGNGGVDVATVNITVIAVNDPPQASATPEAQTVQYSDAIAPVTFTASDIDSAITTSTTFSFNGGSFSPGLPNGLSISAGTLSGIADVPAGVYVIRYTATDGSLSDSADHTLTVNKELTAIEYTGDIYALTAGPSVTTANVRLAAQLTQEADGSPGDITKAKVSFLLFKSGNMGSTPDQTISGVAVDGTGAALTFVNLAADTWCVKVKIDSDNGYWMASSVDISTISIEQPTKELRTSGGGWVGYDESENGKANFGFNVANQKKGVKGSSIFLFRGLDGFNYLVKSTSWNGGGLGFRREGKIVSLASFSGKCVVQKIDPATGEVVESWGNYSFTVDVRDGDLFKPRQADKYAIAILTSSGLVWRQVGSRTSPSEIGGGNVTVKGK